MNQHKYLEETRNLAIKMYYGGISGQEVGEILRINRSNIMHWIKNIKVEKCKSGSEYFDIVELDELYWFLKQKIQTKTRENLYIITDIQANRGHLVSLDKSAQTIQSLVINYSNTRFIIYCPVALAAHFRDN